MQLKRLLIFDGSYMLHRGLKQQHLFDLRNSKLERTGGIYSFLNMFQKEIRLNENYFPIVCWDDGLSDRRLSAYDNYKQHKDKLNDPSIKPFYQMTDDELDEDYVYNYKLQRKKLIEILNLFGIPSLLFKKTEGDDLMYWLSKHCEKSKVITDDRDLLQLLSENCKVRQPMKNTSVELHSFLHEHNFSTIHDFIRTKALCGDDSDNIPGACFRVGEKTAKEFFELYDLLKKHDCVDIISDENKLKEFCKNNNLKFKKAYKNFNENQFLINMELIDLNRIQDFEINENAIYEAIRKVYKNKNVNDVLALLNRYEIKTINTNIIFEALALTRHNIKDAV